MSSTPLQRDDDCHPSLSTAPPEVAINIFCQLPSFSHVFALSAVCRRLRHLWLDSSNTIYNHVAPKAIPCERAARRFLVHQGGPGLELPMSANYVVRVAQNAEMIEHTILHFEREVVWRVQMGGYSPAEKEEFYGPGARQHPSTLTPTERTRFIRSYYSVWGLMKVDRSEWDSRLQEMTSQELHYLNEMTNLTDSIGMEDIDPPPVLPIQPPDSLHSIIHSQEQKRYDLGQSILQQIQRISRRLFEQETPYTGIYAKHEGVHPFVTLWDHWQPSLKDVVLHKGRSVIKPSLAVIQQYLWNDELDE